MPTVTLTPLDVANRLRPALLQLNRALRREAHELGVTSGQAALLGSIMAYPELGPRELAARERISAPAMTRALDRLEAAGWLTRERDPADKRRVRLSVTEKGASTVRSLRSRRTAWLAARLDGLTRSELEEIDAAVGILLSLVEDDE